MNLSLAEYINYIKQNPILMVIFLLIIGVMFVNGGSGASNSIAVCVSTRSLSPKKAIILSSIGNFVGVFVMAMISTSVAQTMFSLADFGANQYASLTALTGGLISIVLWMGVSVLFGIPSSSSHTMSASISGAALALNGLNSFNLDSWKKILLGLFLSTVVGYILGIIVTKIVERICKNMNRQKTIPFFKSAQIVSAGATAFMDGAQDGQKFMGILMLSVAFATGTGNVTSIEIPVWLMFLCSISMSLGTAIGATKMIKSVGMKMVKLEAYQGTCADIANVTCSFVASNIGIPMSTTHTKMSSMMGVGASRNIKKVNWSVVKNMILSWIITFPGCMLLAYVITTILIKIYS